VLPLLPRMEGEGTVTPHPVETHWDDGHTMHTPCGLHLGALCPCYTHQGSVECRCESTAEYR
jgi:hypothetical protein